MRSLLLVFILVPLAELYLLLVVGRTVGFWPTVGLTVVTALVGGSLARREGRRVWESWRQSLQRGEPPEHGVVEGVLVLVGGVLLLTPGLITDVAGVVLLVPVTRRRVAAHVRRVLERRLASGTSPFAGARGFSFPGGSRGVDVIDTAGKSLDD